MVSLHEQLAPIAFAPPPPIVAVPHERRIPADKKAFRAVIAGGYKLTARDLREGLAVFGIEVIAHWDSERKILPASLPSNTELIVLITTVCSHSQSDRARELSQKAGIPLIGVSTKQSAWGKAFARWGILPPDASTPEEPPVTDESAPPREHWGLILKAARKSTGLSAKTIADKIGISQEAMSGYETGKREPPFKVYKGMLEHIPGLRSVPPPKELEGIVFAELAPPPQPPPVEIPAPPPLSFASEAGARYGASVAAVETTKKTIATLQARLAVQTAETERLHFAMLEAAAKEAESPTP